MIVKKYKNYKHCIFFPISRTTYHTRIIKSSIQIAVRCIHLVFAVRLVVSMMMKQSLLCLGQVWAPNKFQNSNASSQESSSVR